LAEIAGDLTKEQRQQLQSRAAALNGEAVRLYQQGQYAAATKVLQQAIALFDRLYPKERYPQGHPHLATSLDNLGVLLGKLGEYGRAMDYAQKALVMRQRLYPKERYPQGHPHLATSLNNLSLLQHSQGEYAQAVGYLTKALRMRECLYPKERYPRGHPDLATSMDNLGAMLGGQGEYAGALDCLQNALAMRERLYPKERYPNGHPLLSTSLNNLGLLLGAQGEYARALGYLQKSLRMGEALYPKARYPQGHPDLAITLNNLGALLRDQGEYARAREYYQKALAIYELLYPKERYPHGHPQLALILNNLGHLLVAQGKYARAVDSFQKALAIYERFYPKERFPQGHPHVAASLGNLGVTLQDQGEYTRARDYDQRALAMYERLYPKEAYPQGHPELAKSLSNLGGLLHAQGDCARARNLIQKALAMYQDLADVFDIKASEAEAFSHLASLPLNLDALLSVSRHLRQNENPVYGFVWRNKAAITRILERRQQNLVQAVMSQKLTRPQRQEVAKLWQQLLDKRRALARLLLASSRDVAGHRKRLQQLSREKMDLEQKLAKLLPDFARQQEMRRQNYDVLVKKLPAGTVFVDVLRYVYFERDPKYPGRAGKRRTASYAAFVLCKDRPIKQVELERAAPIEQAVHEWRANIRRAGRGPPGQRVSPDPPAHKLRALLWEPLAKHIPPGTKTLYIAPDGALARLPWAALPVNRQGRVLLEDHALALVPHGPFLLERLSDPLPPNAGAGTLLAVGAVQYDAQPPAAGGKGLVAWSRAAAWGDRKVMWNPLPATARELDQVVRLAGKRSPHRLTGAEASTTRVLAELPQARWAHLATHGFFADKKLRSVLQIDEKLFDRRAFREGPAPGARNPLVLSGLVLAGANLPLPEDLTERTMSDGGILTAEAIAGLPLHKLELAVLSACETGLGKVAGGEGVFGLQRAFHLAGCKNVVASLWKVDDQATAALMALFYDKMWRQKLPALAALREAQLTLYNYPERIGALAQERGPNFDKVVRLGTGPQKGPKPRPGHRAPAKLWAGFILSGLGR
jgi:CHAT domain-containing protein/Tfp pilus assembly protein PilF